jgi:hypothetical protein
MESYRERQRDNRRGQTEEERLMRKDIRQRAAHASFTVKRGVGGDKRNLRQNSSE